MYDNITLFLETTETSIINELSDIRQIINPLTGETSYRGYIENLRVTVNSNGIKITGSIPKYYFGSNLYYMCQRIPDYFSNQNN